jgi:hypothetical protein
MDDTPDERFEHYDDILLRHLTAMLVAQREANQRQEVTNQERSVWSSSTMRRVYMSEGSCIYAIGSLGEVVA